MPTNEELIRKYLQDWPKPGEWDEVMKEARENFTEDLEKTRHISKNLRAI